MTDKDISERNQKITKFISGLNLGIHIIGFPENPRFLSADYKFLLNGFGKNFKIFLYDKEYNGNLILECRVDADPEKHRETFVEWMYKYEHKRIYALVYGGGDSLFVTGKDYHDKINHKNSYPVFSRFSPIKYNKSEAEEMQEKFSEYNLEINEQEEFDTLSHHSSELFVVGYNHHDIEKTQPYPVFAKYFPHFCYELEKAEELQERYKEYNLEIK